MFHQICISVTPAYVGIHAGIVLVCLAFIGVFINRNVKRTKSDVYYVKKVNNKSI
jgi:hypothetical protein